MDIHNDETAVNKVTNIKKAIPISQFFYSVLRQNINMVSSQI